LCPSNSCKTSTSENANATRKKIQKKPKPRKEKQTTLFCYNISIRFLLHKPQKYYCHSTNTSEFERKHSLVVFTYTQTKASCQEIASEQSFQFARKSFWEGVLLGKSFLGKKNLVNEQDSNMVFLVATNINMQIAKTFRVLMV